MPEGRESMAVSCFGGCFICCFVCFTEYPVCKVYIPFREESLDWEVKGCDSWNPNWQVLHVILTKSWIYGSISPTCKLQIIIQIFFWWQWVAVVNRMVSPMNLTTPVMLYFVWWACLGSHMPLGRSVLVIHTQTLEYVKFRHSTWFSLLISAYHKP